MFRTLPTSALVLLILVACGGSESNDAADQVQAGLQQMQEDQAAPADGGPQPDPGMEQQCASVTQARMDAVEEKMSDLSGEMVVLTADEQVALSCSRYRMYLRGEVSSY